MLSTKFVDFETTLSITIEGRICLFFETSNRCLEAFALQASFNLGVDFSGFSSHFNLLIEPLCCFFFKKGVDILIISLIFFWKCENFRNCFCGVFRDGLTLSRPQNRATRPPSARTGGRSFFGNHPSFWLF